MARPPPRGRRGKTSVSLKREWYRPGGKCVSVETDESSDTRDLCSLISPPSLVVSGIGPSILLTCCARTALTCQTWCTASLPSCWPPSCTRSWRSRGSARCSSKVPQAALWPSCPSATLVLRAAASSTRETKAWTASVSFAARQNASSCRLPTENPLRSTHGAVCRRAVCQNCFSKPASFESQHAVPSR